MRGTGNLVVIYFFGSRVYYDNNSLLLKGEYAMPNATAEKKRFRLSNVLFDTTGMSESTRRSLFYVILAVTVGTICSTISTGAAWTGFVRRLGADAFALGILTAIPVAANSIQIFISYIFERTGKRREIFLWAGIIGRFVWALIGIVPLVMPLAPDTYRVLTVMLLVAVVSSSNAVINIGFYSLVTDIVPMRIRGRYFSARSAVSLAFAVVTGIAVSALIDRTSGFTGYTIALVIAGICGSLDIVCYLRCDWPAMSKPEGKQPSLISMMKSVLKDKPFRRIMIIMTMYGFAVNIAAPFYNVYMLEVVKMTYTQITLINQVLPNLITVAIISWWGRMMDEHGNVPVMRLTGSYMMIYPFLWLLSGLNSFMMIIALNVITGMVSNAFDLSGQNMYLNAAPTVNRSMYISVYFACTQLLGNALGNTLGGYLLQNAAPLLEAANRHVLGFTMTRYHYMFLASGILRLIVVLGFMPMMKEESNGTVKELIASIGHDITFTSKRFVKNARKLIRSGTVRRNKRIIEQSNPDLSKMK